MTSGAPLVFSPVTSQLSDHRLRPQTPISRNRSTSKHSFRPPAPSHLAFILSPYHITPFYFLNCTEQSLKPLKNALTVCFPPDFQRLKDGALLCGPRILRILDVSAFVDCRLPPPGLLTATGTREGDLILVFRLLHQSAHAGQCQIRRRGRPP